MSAIAGQRRGNCVHYVIIITCYVFVLHRNAEFIKKNDSNRQTEKEKQRKKTEING